MVGFEIDQSVAGPNIDSPSKIEETDDRKYILRGEKKFERRLNNERTDDDLKIPENYPSADSQAGIFVKMFCSMKGAAKTNDPTVRKVKPPDDNFHADCFVQLSEGLTAYHFIEPSSVSEDMAEEVPVIVCLHGLTNSSYMWADVVDLLADSEQGPQARVLVFDFYGRGRSPWTGVPITLDVLVTQTKELLDCKCHLYFGKSSYCQFTTYYLFSFICNADERTS